MKLNNEKLLEIVQAAIDGKTIQIAVIVEGKKEWRDIDHLLPGYGEKAYRIKPEPKLVKGAAYLCWDDGDDEQMLYFYLGKYRGQHKFTCSTGCMDVHNGVTWDNYELFVQPPEALRGEEVK